MLNKLGKELLEESKELFGEDWIDNNPLTFYMLMVTEISKAAEEARKKAPGIYYKESGGGKPEGEAIELADTIMRILNYCALMGFDIEEAIRIKREFNTNKRNWKTEEKRV